MKRLFRILAILIICSFIIIFFIQTFFSQNTTKVNSDLSVTTPTPLSMLTEQEIKQLLLTDRTTLVTQYNLILNGGSSLDSMDGYLRLEGSSVGSYCIRLPIKNLIVCVFPPSDFTQKAIYEPTQDIPYMLVVLPEENSFFLNKYNSSCTIDQVSDSLIDSEITSYFTVADENEKEGEILFWQNNDLCYQFVFPNWNNNKLCEIRIWLAEIN